MPAQRPGPRPARTAGVAVLIAAAMLMGLTAPASAAVPDSTTEPPPTTQQCLVATGFACYNVNQIHNAYDMGPLLRRGLDGAGQTIALIPPLHLPNLAHDLAVFSRAFGLPSADLRVLSLGPLPTPDPTNQFDTFGALDNASFIEWAHAMAPRAKLLIIEGGGSYDSVVPMLIHQHLADVIALNGGDGEVATGRDAVLTSHTWAEEAARAHIPLISEAGEIGRLSLLNPTAGPDAWFPGTDPLVTSVGTLELTLDDRGRRTAPDRIWNDSARVPLPLAGGGGLSQIFDRPNYQHGLQAVVGTHRGVPDLAMAGGCDGRLISYSSYDTFDFYVSQQPEPAGWQPFCSSSQSTSLFAGLVAIAQQAAGRHLGPLNPKLYHATDAFEDVTVGTNAVPATSFSPADPGDAATPGYDLVSGWGSPDAGRLVAGLSQD